MSLKATSPSSQVVLEVRNITKTFPGVVALDRVNFELKKGEIHALVGENGAGKSTLMHILGGIYSPDAGQIIVEGQPVRFNSPYSATSQGISVVFQELSLVPNLSVAENIFFNRQPLKRFNLIDWDKLYSDTQKMLDLFGVDISPTVQVKYLSTGQQQIVEILKAMSYEPKVLILDEPTSSLTQNETEQLFANLRKLKSEGISVIFISHHLQEVFQIADRVTVLRDGQYVGTRYVNDITEDDLVTMMVGRELLDMYGRRTNGIGEEYFRVERISRGSDFSDISFSLRRGEILGIAGLVGAGRTEVGRAIFGVEPITSGSIYLNGQKIRVSSPEQAINYGIGYLTEDRKIQGLYLKMSITENCVAPSLKRFQNRLGMLVDEEMEKFADDYRRKFRIVTPSLNQKVMNLSGGNQQKVLLSMWMGINPSLLIVDEPTKGVDVGAKSDIYRLLRELAHTGVGIIMISSDLPEILGLSDRVLVMRNGRLVGEFDKSEVTEEKVVACATGVTANSVA